MDFGSGNCLGNPRVLFRTYHGSGSSGVGGPGCAGRRTDGKIATQSAPPVDAGYVGGAGMNEQTIGNAGEEVLYAYIKDIHFFLLVYGIVGILLSLRWILATMSILRLRKWGSCYDQDGYMVVRNNRVSSPFSFFRMIFINRKLEGESLQVVIAYEKSHIDHKHYRDTFLMELFCIIFWFNPFVWLIKRELRALHEFEVDQHLLTGGLELSKYQNIIFDELMGYGPAIANGFHNSLIKKRFIMMKNVNPIRYRLLRKVILIPALAGVVALFAFTGREAVVDNVWLPVMSEVAALDIPLNRIGDQTGLLASDAKIFELKPVLCSYLAEKFLPADYISEPGVF